MDTGALKRMIDEFEAAHTNGEPSVVGRDGVVWYADGATMQPSFRGLADCLPPPPEAYRRALLVVRYWEVRLELLSDKFDRIKVAAAAREETWQKRLAILERRAADAGLRPEEKKDHEGWRWEEQRHNQQQTDALLQLQQYKTEIDYCQTKLVEARDAADAADPSKAPKRSPAEAEAAAEQAEVSKAYLEQLEALKI
jgi:hypothetical protein